MPPPPPPLSLVAGYLGKVGAKRLGGGKGGEEGLNGDGILYLPYLD
jgi:hypothetical protein